MEPENTNQNNSTTKEGTDNKATEKISPEPSKVNLPPKNETGTNNSSILQEKDDIEIPTLRTYKQDIKEAVKNEDITSTRILLEEQRKKVNTDLTDEAVSIKSPKNKLLIFVGLLLIFLAGGIFSYRYFMPTLGPEKKFLIERPDFISIEKQTEVATELRNKRDIYNDIEKIIIEPITDETIHEIVLTKTRLEVVGDTTKQTKELISTLEFFALLEGRAPDSLLRSLDNNFMFGIYGFNVGEPFVLFKVTDFENSFASLLMWEPTMAQDFQPIFFTNYKPEELLKTPEQAGQQNINLKNASTTASTTDSINIAPRLNFDPTSFEDRVIFNTDARIIKDEFGEILFFYTFINDEYLIFTREEKALEEIVNRLRQARFIR